VLLVKFFPKSFREISKSSSRPVGTAVLKSLTPKAFGIEQNPWFCKALLKKQFINLFFRLPGNFFLSLNIG